LLRIIAISLLILLSCSACMKDDELWDFESPGLQIPYRGVFVTNEGNFTYGNASLSYYDMETGEVFNDVFFKTNALPMGDVAYSMTIQDGLGYVVVNNSGRIYVINTSTFEYVGKITGLTSPRYMHFISDNKAYVSDLYARSIAVVNPLSMEVTGSIDVSSGSSQFTRHATEMMVQFDKYVYVNCWSYDNQVLVIDSESDRVIDSIEVLKQPNSMVLDASDNLWILTDGGFPESPYGYEEPGLLKVEAGARMASIIYRFESGETPSELRINGTGDTIYFLNRHVYSLPLYSGQDPGIFIPSPYASSYPGGFYGLEVDQATSEVYVADALDFVQRGMIYRFAPDGMPVDTFRAGIAPGSFCFKPSN